MVIVEKKELGWVLAELNGKKGHVPEGFIKILGRVLFVKIVE